MKHYRFLFLFFFALAIDADAEAPLTASTIVVYNKTVSDSVALATFYAQQRGIARDHLIGLACSTEEEISREEYDTTIAEPLREIFKSGNGGGCAIRRSKRLPEAIFILLPQ